MEDLKYRLYVSAKGAGLPPEMFDSCYEQDEILPMVEAALTAGYCEFVVVLG